MVEAEDNTLYSEQVTEYMQKLRDKSEAFFKQAG